MYCRYAEVFGTGQLLSFSPGMWVRILSNLSVEDLCYGRLICGFLNTVLDDELLWRALALEQRVDFHISWRHSILGINGSPSLPSTFSITVDACLSPRWVKTWTRLREPIRLNVDHKVLDSEGRWTWKQFRSLAIYIAFIYIHTRRRLRTCKLKAVIIASTFLGERGIDWNARVVLPSKGEEYRMRFPSYDNYIHQAFEHDVYFQVSYQSFLQYHQQVP